MFLPQLQVMKRLHKSSKYHPLPSLFASLKANWENMCNDCSWNNLQPRLWHKGVNMNWAEWGRGDEFPLI